MKGSLFIAKISGIKIFIHWTFLFLIAWIMMDNFRNGNGMGQALYTIAFILAVFLCVTLHELGHALMAKRFHYATRDITLLPIGGMARIDEIPENPKHELAVAIAGPAVNFLIKRIPRPCGSWQNV